MCTWLGPAHTNPIYFVLDALCGTAIKSPVIPGQLFLSLSQKSGGSRTTNMFRRSQIPSPRRWVVGGGMGLLLIPHKGGTTGLVKGTIPFEALIVV